MLFGPEEATVHRLSLGKALPLDLVLSRTLNHGNATPGGPIFRPPSSQLNRDGIFAIRRRRHQDYVLKSFINFNDTGSARSRPMAAPLRPGNRHRVRHLPGGAKKQPPPPGRQTAVRPRVCAARDRECVIIKINYQ